MENTFKNASAVCTLFLFCFFSPRHFGHIWWYILVAETFWSFVSVVLKLTVTVFFSLYFQTFWPKRLYFFRSFQNQFGLWPKKNRSVQHTICRHSLPVFWSWKLSKNICFLCSKVQIKGVARIKENIQYMTSKNISINSMKLKFTCKPRLDRSNVVLRHSVCTQKQLICYTYIKPRTNPFFKFATEKLVQQSSINKMLLRNHTFWLASQAVTKFRFLKNVCHQLSHTSPLQV